MLTYLAPKLSVGMLQQAANVLDAGMDSRLSFQKVLPDLAHQRREAHEGKCIIIRENHKKWRQDVAHPCNST